ncbi:DUF2637 domain-containing protein [Actinopolyspora halophila]|uniref:DUF2637 domain-containing protein n=1 Tax=Actinopolyspora halophila TaxID=1850 RepID=UPI00036C5F51|nr:DUF2637 domain-containing protein [Actinopolyspora halophila]
MSTRFVDPGAARTAARGEAERARAEAESVRAETRRAMAEDAARRAREERAEREQRKQRRAAERRQRLASVVSWIQAHPTELLMSVIVVVPALLAWSAMAAYGVEIYGSLGGVLPLFSEGAMWAFAFSVHLARRQGRPTGWLHTGVWTFAAVNATLNFLHGFGASGVVVGLVMALVSVGGVVAHQLITAAPLRTRRSRTERAATRTARIAQRRRVRMERAAVRRSVGELAEDGTIRLRHSPGTVTLRRSRFGGHRLRDAVVPGLTPSGSRKSDEPHTGEQLAVEIGRWLSGESTSSEPAGTAKTGSGDPAVPEAGTNDELAELVIRARQAIEAGELNPRPSRRAVQRHLGIRATTAQEVLRALRGRGGDGEAEVAA